MKLKAFSFSCSVALELVGHHSLPMAPIILLEPKVPVGVVASTLVNGGGNWRVGVFVSMLISVRVLVSYDPDDHLPY